MIIQNLYLKPPINYIGNKYRLLPQIIPYIPDGIVEFVDLFGGSGVVCLNVNAQRHVYNDINVYVAQIFEGLYCEDMESILDFVYNLINEYSLSRDNIGGFEQLRERYNKGDKDWKVLYTLMCFSFNNMYRFNTAHDYNSSFGKEKCVFGTVTIDKLKAAKARMKKMRIQCLGVSFERFAFYRHNFVYADPPYLNSLGTYQDGKRGFEGWDESHEQKLRSLLVSLHDRGIRWLLSNNLTVNDTLEDWAVKYKFGVVDLTYTYSNSNYQKIAKEKDREVIIKNYD